ncbi:hypothetical protein Bbelb_062580 [Branchiostoma belcheri]|nr:hypothetical protein Bbelb_062580 [Branchiostoma belcheri]
MPPQSVPQRAYNSRKSGPKARGRPRKKWIDAVKDTLNRHGPTLTTASRLAVSRQLYLPTTPQMVEQGKVNVYRYISSADDTMWTQLSTVTASRARGSPGDRPETYRGVPRDRQETYRGLPRDPAQDAQHKNGASLHHLGET